MNWFVPTSSALAILAQNRLLKYYVKSSYESKTAHALNYVVIKNKNQSTTSPAWKRKERVLVLMHGFGLGLGFFYANFDALSQHYDRVIAVDWPGMGCSSRDVSFGSSGGTALGGFLPSSISSLKEQFISPFLTNQQRQERSVREANVIINQFVDSLENVLRVEEDVSTEFTLAGHSLGGYFAGKYALKYPQQVEKLILISPVGIPNAPAVSEQIPDNELDWRIRSISQLIKWDITPQTIVRLMGSKGPAMITDVINRRFSKRWKGEELDLISDYLYHITAAPGSGEYALNALLDLIFVKSDTSSANTAAQSADQQRRSGVYAKLPLETDLCSLKVPILLIYGDNDWLYYPTAEQSVQKWRQAGAPRADLAIIPQAGHHLYLDNAPAFNQRVLSFVADSSDK